MAKNKKQSNVISLSNKKYSKIEDYDFTKKIVTPDDLVEAKFSDLPEFDDYLEDMEHLHNRDQIVKSVDNGREDEYEKLEKAERELNFSEYQETLGTQKTGKLNKKQRKELKKIKQETDSFKPR